MFRAKTSSSSVGSNRFDLYCEYTQVVLDCLLIRIRGKASAAINLPTAWERTKVQAYEVHPSRCQVTTNQDMSHFDSVSYHYGCCYPQLISYSHDPTSAISISLRGAAKCSRMNSRDGRLSRQSSRTCLKHPGYLFAPQRLLPRCINCAPQFRLCHQTTIFLNISRILSPPLQTQHCSNRANIISQYALPPNLPRRRAGSTGHRPDTTELHQLSQHRLRRSSRSTTNHHLAKSIVQHRHHPPHSRHSNLPKRWPGLGL